MLSRSARVAASHRRVGLLPFPALVDRFERLVGGVAQTTQLLRRRRGQRRVEGGVTWGRCSSCRDGFFGREVLRIPEWGLRATDATAEEGASGRTTRSPESRVADAVASWKRCTMVLVCEAYDLSLATATGASVEGSRPGGGAERSVVRRDEVGVGVVGEQCALR